MTSSPTPAVLPDARALEDEWHALSARADQDTGNESEDMAALGLRDGYEQAVQTLDVLTGGDGEFRYCTVPDDRHCPDPPAMIRRIVERFTPPAIDAAVPAGHDMSTAEGRWKYYRSPDSVTAAAPKVASDTGAITPEWCLRMADLEAGQEIGAGALDHPLRTKCELPPAGWICTRTPGHDGPCATVASDTGAGLREALAKEFRDASRGYGRAGTAEMRDGPYMSMGDAAGVYADLMLSKAASDVGEAFDLNGIKKLWRTGVETGRILQQADTSKAGFSEQAWAEAVRETDRHCYELDITNADHIVLWLEHQLNGHVGPLAYIACRILDAHEAALATNATDGATGGGKGKP